MENCTHFRRLIEALVADELAPAAQLALREHARDCPDCRALVDLHLALVETGRDSPEPDDDDLHHMRESVLDAVGGACPAATGSFWRELAGVFTAHPLPAATLIVLLIAAAGLGGRLLFPVRTLMSNATPDQALLAAVEAQAANYAGLAGYWDAPLAFENVEARPRLDGRLDFSVDVIRHVALAAAPESPIARELLLHAILDRGNMGGRLRAMDLSPSALDPQLEEALVFALHKDPDTAIRLKALAVLRGYPDSPRVRNALLTVLREDPSVELRLLALEALAAYKVPGEDVRQAILASPRQADDAVLEYAKEIARF